MNPPRQEVRLLLLRRGQDHRGDWKDKVGGTSGLVVNREQEEQRRRGSSLLLLISAVFRWIAPARARRGLRNRHSPEDFCASATGRAATGAPRMPEAADPTFAAPGERERGRPRSAWRDNEHRNGPTTEHGARTSRSARGGEGGQKSSRRSHPDSRMRAGGRRSAFGGSWASGRSGSGAHTLGSLARLCEARRRAGAPAGHTRVPGFAATACVSPAMLTAQLRCPGSAQLAGRATRRRRAAAHRCASSRPCLDCALFSNYL